MNKLLSMETDHVFLGLERPRGCLSRDGNLNGFYVSCAVWFFKKQKISVSVIMKTKIPVPKKSIKVTGMFQSTRNICLTFSEFKSARPNQT